jgi:hypothetical protein
MWCVSSSPSGGTNLLKLINEATGRKFSQVLMMGDFNFPNGDWESWNNKSDNTETQDYKFIHCIQLRICIFFIVIFYFC